ncbi:MULTISPECIES: hypothetical protein [Acinetobacter calcoaceticus/baumannii complex]|uniref:hypothetical protein n=1 Tax=Acinetobacter calcoaceticus/baumannii complex TaxID=909768 RepID=UPI0008395ED8|nr:hypothetical protein [Acinetobacter pittii]MCK0901470.1 hypothetical protein [Acinetobacter pittii]MDX8187516.1 hypothetical protein [Acinetobacter pittii]WPP83458.1 hypothetical protein SOI74_12080 [Acinetobacter pittii]
MNKSAISISIFIIGLIILLLLICIFGIFYFYWGDSKAIQDSLSTTGSIFGAIATLGAAGIAAFLFNDWREEHNHTFKSSILLEYLNRLDILEEISNKYLSSLKYHSKVYSSQYKATFSSGTSVGVFIELIEYHHELFYEGEFNTWTNANKFSLLDDLEFKEVYQNIIRNLNMSFDLRYSINNLLRDNKLEDISENKIQNEIDLAIQEIIEALEQIKSIQKKAILEIKAIKKNL